MNINRYINKIRLKKLVKNGLNIGQNFKMEKGCMIDASFPWLITFGDNVTLAPYVYILAHDGSTKPFLDYSKVGKVVIGNNVFIGTKSVVLPNITIGNNVVIAAGSIVTKNIQDNVVVAGNPATVICTIDEFINKNKIKLNNSNSYDQKFTISGGVSIDKKNKMNFELKSGIGFIK